MAAQTARYYLERSLVELEDLREQALFDKNELSIIMRRRTDFEHRIASRATKPKDFLRYAEYEINVEKLRLKRVARLGKEASEEDQNDIEAEAAAQETGTIRDKKLGRGISSYAGPRRIFFIFDRATKKYPAEIALLWIPYLRFAKSQGAIFVQAKIYSRLLQLHPTSPAVWIMAAKHELDSHNAIRSARSIMQRGLRFNPTSAVMWLEYMKLELIYVAQLLARRKVLGLVTEAQQKHDESLNSIDSTQDSLTSQKDVIEIPDSHDAVFEQKAAKELKALPDVDVNMLGDPSTNPALRGDIALLVFDSAIPALVTYTNDSKEKQKILLAFATSVLDLLVDFAKTSLDVRYLATHVINSMASSSTSSSSSYPLPAIALWSTILPIRYLSPTDPTFPDSLREVLDAYTKTYIRGVYAKAPQSVRIDYATSLASYLHARFLLDQENDRETTTDDEGENNKEYETIDNSKSELEPNLRLIVNSLVKKCETQQ
ncbi:uncharacterized protein SAPINGB_P002478 [Magnusiomyces paraingens]|uniref:U3 small nucleolar RNA-associated protein 6 N-terminal domain-containing protein n=1 Tax=Magnusiomyces paraingens TaxID=2606893 RepID=A0A5E8BJW4_9ASCO|nr:uncharacterized protein SAPINGB_P002478 [Saprochaete ingens]VVT49857.1 unnamed protein product [Saprochaete ingens]